LNGDTSPWLRPDPLALALSCSNLRREAAGASDVGNRVAFANAKLKKDELARRLISRSPGPASCRTSSCGLCPAASLSRSRLARRPSPLS